MFNWVLSYQLSLRKSSMIDFELGSEYASESAEKFTTIRANSSEQLLLTSCITHKQLLLTLCNVKLFSLQRVRNKNRLQLGTVIGLILQDRLILNQISLSNHFHHRTAILFMRLHLVYICGAYWLYFYHLQPCYLFLIPS